ncbi:hypothetical protein DY052_06185 [Apilactobacillus timberlakei]|uniref:hypothetical protein n=1 Tax=Apilactobacillus timberlakei TaxID=2008380 RepID=UPI00112DAE04|nr:hypothetical protein [Apilactobacillus timberlakei]TPR15012.1 hypothetical protein DY052_06185 [Apilactobacillus timberlakei]
MKNVKIQNLGDATRYSFIGTFERLGYKNNIGTLKTSISPILFLKNIILVDDNHSLINADDSQLIFKHITLNYGKQFLKLGELHNGDKLFFKARVCKYTKRFNPMTTTNYKLERPSKISKLDNSYNGDLPLDKNAVVGYIMNKNRKLYSNKNDYKDNIYTWAYRKWLKS